MAGTDDDVYSFGECGGCGKIKPLKNRRCHECQIRMPEFFNQLFGGKNE
jgi:hypothetical protein